jgi:hypothetical protein
MPIELVTSRRGPTFRPHNFPVEDTRFDVDPYACPSQRNVGADAQWVRKAA